MTTLSARQALALLSAMPAPIYCEGCDTPFSDAARSMLPYGPFQVHLCPDCAGRFAKRVRRNKPALVVI